MLQPPAPSAALVCADCGHVFAPPERRELKVVEGELVEQAFRSGPYKNGDIKKGDIVLCFANRCNYKVMDIRKNGAISVMQDHPRATKCWDVYVNQITDIISSQSEQKPRARQRHGPRSPPRASAATRLQARMGGTRAIRRGLAKRHGI
jgi:hypothetical protein